MTDLPYTYTDEDDVALRVDRGVCTAYDRPGRVSVSFYAPKGEYAVRLARAVLAAAGDTGHEVVEVASVSHAIRSAEEEVARLTSERDRLRTAWESARRGRTQARAQLADARRYVRILGEQRADLRREVRAAETRLPEDDTVEPDGTDTTPVYESPQELAQEIEQLRTALKTAEADRDRYLAENATAYSQGVEDMRDAATTAAFEADLDTLPGLGRRVWALEQKVADLGETNIRSTELLTERIAQMERDAESAETRVDNLHAADGALARLAALEQQYRLHRRFTAQDDG